MFLDKLANFMYYTTKSNEGGHIEEKDKKLVSDAMIIGSRFFSHKVGQLPEKVESDLLIIKKEIKILGKNNQKKVKPFFRDIIGTMKKILIFKDQDQIDQLIDDTFTVSVFPMLNNAYEAYDGYTNRPKELKYYNEVLEELSKTLHKTKLR